MNGKPTMKGLPVPEKCKYQCGGAIDYYGEQPRNDYTVSRAMAEQFMTEQST
jgi:hypothetical protein